MDQEGREGLKVGQDRGGAERAQVEVEDAGVVEGCLVERVGVDDVLDEGDVGGEDWAVEAVAVGVFDVEEVGGGDAAVDEAMVDAAVEETAVDEAVEEDGVVEYAVVEDTAVNDATDEDATEDDTEDATDEDAANDDTADVEYAAEDDGLEDPDALG